MICDKYKVEKTDGTPLDENAKYFVLRVDNDQIASLACMFYAVMIAKKDEQHSIDLINYLQEVTGSSGDDYEGDKVIQIHKNMEEIAKLIY